MSMDVHCMSHILCIFFMSSKGRENNEFQLVCVGGEICNRLLIFTLKSYAFPAMAPYMSLHRLGIRQTTRAKSLPCTYSVQVFIPLLFVLVPPVAASRVPATLIPHSHGNDSLLQFLMALTLHLLPPQLHSTTWK